ncbi:MAG: RNA-binding protein [Clostridia bacterium]|nr:RNA-binding protein [Clostridia bacterium]
MDNDKDLKIFLSHIMDLENACFTKNIPCATGFLDMQKQLHIHEIKNKFRTGFVLWGGFPEAERKILLFLPDYDIEKEDYLRVIRAAHGGGKTLSHRDYLGSVLNLGIKRDLVGDILVSENSADIIIKPEIEDFLYTNLSKAARQNLSLEALPITDIKEPETETKEIKFSVSSLRLDSVLASVFNLSRTKAAEAVSAQCAYVNDVLCLKPDKSISGGDKITLRRKGRVIISEIGGESRKGKTFVTAKVYK